MGKANPVGKLGFANIQGQILPPCIYAIGFCTQERQGNSIPYAVFVKRKFPGEQTNSQSFAKGKAIFSRVALQESIFLCSGRMLPEKPHSRDFCTQPISPQGTPKHNHRATSDCPCSLACSALQSQHNYLDK